MKLPIRKLVRPGVLARAVNGKLSRQILDVTPGVDGGADVTLVEPAGRAWRAMVAAAATVGIVLKVATPGRSYRPYSEQEAIFRARYTPHSWWAPGRRRWNGYWWSKKRGFAAAAVPGTSNHGWGLAVDIGQELDGDRGTESISDAAVRWLIDNAHLYGWSAELQSEKWHWRYVAGDQVPAAVLAFEAQHSNEEDTMILLHDIDSDTWRVAVPGEGSAVIADPAHWAGVIVEGRKTGIYRSKYISNLIAKIRAERG